MVLDCVSVDRCAATVDDNEARLQRYQKHQQKRKIVIEVVKSSFAIYKVSWTPIRSTSTGTENTRPMC